MYVCMYILDTRSTHQVLAPPTSSTTRGTSFTSRLCSPTYQISPNCSYTGLCHRSPLYCFAIHAHTGQDGGICAPLLPRTSPPYPTYSTYPNPCSRLRSTLLACRHCSENRVSIVCNPSILLALCQYPGLEIYTLKSLTLRPVSFQPQSMLELCSLTLSDLRC